MRGLQRATNDSNRHDIDMSRAGSSWSVGVLFRPHVCTSNDVHQADWPDEHALQVCACQSSNTSGLIANKLMVSRLLGSSELRSLSMTCCTWCRYAVGCPAKKNEDDNSKGYLGPVVGFNLLVQHGLQILISRVKALQCTAKTWRQRIDRCQ